MGKQVLCDGETVGCGDGAAQNNESKLRKFPGSGAHAAFVQISFCEPRNHRQECPMHKTMTLAQPFWSLSVPNVLC